MDEHQRDVGIEEQEPEPETTPGDAERDEDAAADVWGADDPLGDAESPGT